MSVSEFGVRKHALLAAAAVSSLSLEASALAQNKAQSTELSEMLVTDEMHTETLQKVPLSGAIIPAEDVRAASAGGDDTLLYLSGKVTSFYAETTTGRIFPRFYIRGL